MNEVDKSKSFEETVIVSSSKSSNLQPVLRPEAESIAPIMSSPPQNPTELHDKTLDSAMSDQTTLFAGWLLKRYGSSQRDITYRTRYFYLLYDRLCYTKTEGPSKGVVKYIPLDRIPVRAYPRGYRPKLAVTVLEHSVMGGGRHAGCCISLQCGDVEHCLVADTPELAKRWEEALNEAWIECCSHSRRMLRLNTPAERQFHKEHLLQAEIARMKTELAEKEVRLQERDSELWLRWLEAQERVVRLERQLAERVVYTILVYTGNKKGASSSAQAWIVLIGEDGNSSGPHTLYAPSGHKPLQRNSTDKFEINTGLLKNLKSIRIGHNGAGSSPSWYLDKVRVRCEKDKTKWTFPCRQWLSSDMHDGSLERTLLAAAEEARALRYIVTVYTSDRPGAGTDANVSIILRGDKCNSGLRLLSKGAHDFERGSMDTFEVESEDLGNITEVSIGHDNHGLAPSWHLEQVEVRDVANDKVHVFPCRQWLDADSGDRSVQRVLTCNTSQAAEVLYILDVHTGSVPGAGTDCMVCAELCGASRSSGMHPLSASRNDFQRGAVNRFYIECPDLGPIQKLTIGHDGKGVAQAWFLSEVVLTTEDSADPTYFPCDDWLESAPAGAPVSRDLLAHPHSVAHNKRTYTIHIETSDVHGGSTSANVRMQIVGRRACTAPLLLTGGRNSYVRGGTDTFQVTCTDVGDVHMLRVSHDASGFCPDWHLAKIRVIPEGEAEVVFPYHGWVDPPSKGGTPSVELNLGDKAEPLVRYLVEVHTSNVRGAGTDANVSITLRGDDASTLPVPLEAARDDFKRGRVDRFFVATRPLGRLLAVLVSHDNSGRAPSWHLNRVLVTPPGASQPVCFPCGRWLAVDQDDGSVARELLALGSSRTQLCQYKLQVTTSDVRFAGTDSSIFFELKGMLGSSGQLSLDIPYKSAFDRGAVDKVLMVFADVGKMESLEVWHDNSGARAGWHLAHVEVDNTTTREKATFVCNDWLHAEMGDRKTRRILLASTVNPFVEKVNYKVTIRTSDIRYAGTDSMIYIMLHGDLLESAPARPLLDGNADQPFRRGQEDTFILTLPNVGSVNGVTLTSDGLGDQTSWHVATVEVQAVSSGEQRLFECNQWLSKSKGDKQLTRRLQPADPANQEAKAKYRVRVVTSDLRDAGTDAGVAVTLYGVKDGVAKNTGSLKLTAAVKELFDRGQTDEFELTGTDVGEVTRLRIGHDGAGAHSGWHLQQVQVEHLGTKQVALFLCNKWLDKGPQGSGEISCELVKESGAEGKKTPMHKYEVLVVTSDVRSAGTSADVHITMSSANGSIGPTLLTNPSPDLFQRGAHDKFIVEGPPIGEITSIEIGHNNKGGNAGWHLDRVEIWSEEGVKPTVFPCMQWLDAAQSDRKTTRQLSASASSGAAPTVLYQVKVFTSNIRGAGTDASVYLVLHGTKVAQTHKLPLEGVSKDLFGRAKVDAFELLAPDVGEVTAVTVGHDGHGTENSWHLDKVEVRHPTTGIWQTFPCRHWLSKRMEGGKLERTLQADSSTASNQAALAEYKVVVTTGNIRGAATDATVFVDLHGGDTAHPGGRVSTGRINLLQPGLQSTLFDRGQMDSFVFKARNVGKVEAITIGHDGMGDSPAWFCEQVEVVNVTAAPALPVTFMCRRWMGGDMEDGKLERELLPSLPQTGSSRRVEYRLGVTTGDVRDAGTDADVAITLHGSRGTIGPMPLDVPYNSHKEPFQRGQTDVFTFEETDIGLVDRVDIGHNGKGASPAWMLDTVELTNISTGETTLFVCKAWLDAHRGDGATSRVLHASSAHLQDSTTIKAASIWSDVQPDVSAFSEPPATSTMMMVSGLDSGGAPKIDVAKSAVAEYKTIKTDMDSLVDESTPRYKPQSSVPAALPIPESFPTLKTVPISEDREAPQLAEELPHTAAQPLMSIGSGSANQTSQRSADIGTVQAAVANEQGTSVVPASSAAVHSCLQSKEGPQQEEAPTPRLSIDQSAELNQEPLADKVPDEILSSVDTFSDLNNSPRTSLPRPASGEVPSGGSLDAHIPASEAEQAAINGSLILQEDTGTTTKSTSASCPEHDHAFTAAIGGVLSPETATELQDVHPKPEEDQPAEALPAEMTGTAPPDKVVAHSGSEKQLDRNAAGADTSMSSDAIPQAPSTSHSAVSLLGDLPSLGAAKLLPVHAPQVSHSAPSMHTLQQSPTETAANLSSQKKSSKKAAVYSVVFFTSDIPEAGSTSSVELVLDGKSARCGRKTFVPSPTQLQRGGQDEFIVETSKDLGPLQRVVIGIKDGSGSDWHLEKLEVTDVSTRACYTYPANRWLSKSRGDGKTTVVLHEGHASTTPRDSAKLPRTDSGVAEY